MMRGRRDPVVGFRLIIQLTLVVVFATLVPLLLGIWLDSYFHTSPLMTLFMVGLGLVLGTVAVSRRVNAVYKQLSGGKE